MYIAPTNRWGFVQDMPSNEEEELITEHETPTQFAQHTRYLKSTVRSTVTTLNPSRSPTATKTYPSVNQTSTYSTKHGTTASVNILPTPILSSTASTGETSSAVYREDSFPVQSIIAISVSLVVIVLLCSGALYYSFRPRPSDSSDYNQPSDMTSQRSPPRNNWSLARIINRSGTVSSIERIIDVQQRDGTTQYFVRYLDHATKQFDWVDASKVKEADVERFWNTQRNGLRNVPTDNITEGGQIVVDGDRQSLLE
ncbi:hypothetical protein BCR33DRAFT_716465 [Rhizoclosmatium globosum]|uniref:Chromo domain-containing protein n=1 Tax=Rhizoclosmatium globosum TaxID=329046 RepID=A0A1Y2CE09_9FUNG|nr:hypothetical protein BCR33DRAFT_716465 [Rhizoclosmatium globosum]|eukprot:ORY45127.1 hypothetical protein BCR33DRAFT_716465 [Rhizoclosmatium globosum]